MTGTSDLGILYQMRVDGDFFCYTDSEYAVNILDKKSTWGYVFMLGYGVISWFSKKKTIVTLLTTEVEYVVATCCTCQEVWLKNIFEELHFKHDGPTPIYYDNTSAINLSKNPV